MLYQLGGTGDLQQELLQGSPSGFVSFVRLPWAAVAAVAAASVIVFSLVVPTVAHRGARTMVGAFSPGDQFALQSEVARGSATVAVDVSIRRLSDKQPPRSFNDFMAFGDPADDDANSFSFDGLGRLTST